MIELLNARRMIVVIVVLILVCIIIVILEENITENVERPTPHMEKINNNDGQKSGPKLDEKPRPLDQQQQRKNISELNIGCWNYEPYHIELKCSPCLSLERGLSYCSITGYKEMIKCHRSDISVPRSCDNVNASSLFYVFEFFMLCMSIVFTFYVRNRQSYLNRLILNRIEKQISAGV